MKSLYCFIMTFSLFFQKNLNAFIPSNSIGVSKILRNSLSILQRQMHTSSNNSDKIVVLEKGKAKLFQGGNPIVYGGAIKEVKGDPDCGSFVDVQDHFGNSIGKGLFNPHSTYRVRMLSRSYEKEYSLDLENLLKARLQQAVTLRKALLLPSDHNSAYRLINGEGDRLGGLIVDVLGSSIVIQSSAVWVEIYRNLLEEAIKNTLQNDTNRYIWRRSELRLKQDGFEGVIANDAPDTLIRDIVVENGVQYVVYPDDGQKTGFYCDQRSNRQFIRQISHGKRVLDTFSYSGGFALNAALGGATAVTAVDSSQFAVDMAIENAKINGVSEIVKGVKMDALKYMKELQDAGELFDIVICDPPKLAPTRSSLDKAKSKYIKINSQAMALVKPGGLLLTCTCSAAMTQSGEFRRVIADAAKLARKDVTILSTTNAAGDHPVHLGYPEGEYLTALLLQIT